MITKEQYDFLTRPLDPGRVGQRQGQSHLEAWDVRRHLIRVFGFGGFDIETIRSELVREIESPPGTITFRNKDGERTNHRTVWTVVYRAEVRLSIKAPDGAVIARYEDGATGDANNLPTCGDAHDFALKTALSQALKRCATNLGDAFGLGLYNGGRTDAVVLRSLVVPDGVQAAAPPAQETPVQPEPARVEAEPAVEVATPAAPVPNQVRDWALQPDRTPDGLESACQRLQAKHPQVAAVEVTNEHGDPEQLQVLMLRRARELAPAGGQTEPQQSAEERRRKRMQALLGELGYQKREERLGYLSLVLGRDIDTSKDLRWPREVEQIIAALERQQRQPQQQPQPEGVPA
jgi:hypothetical protein